MDLTFLLPSDLPEVVVKVISKHDKRMAAAVNAAGCKGVYLMPSALVAIRGEPDEVREAIQKLGDLPDVWAVELASDKDRQYMLDGWSPAEELSVEEAQVAAPLV